jgi:hypothetical protein
LCERGTERSAHTTVPLGTLQSARSQVGPRIWHNGVGCERAGQVFELYETGRDGRAPVDPSPQTAAGRDRMTRPSRRSSSQGSCLRILDQGLGPTRARCSRNRLLEPLCTRARLAQGWAGHPSHARRTQLTSTGTPGPVVDAPRSITHWASRKRSIGFTSLAPLRRRAGRGSSAHRTRPWPWSRSRRGWSAVFPKPQFRHRHERPGFPTANGQISNELKAALVDEPMAQLHGCATPILKLLRSA